MLKILGNSGCSQLLRRSLPHYRLINTTQQLFEAEAIKVFGIESSCDDTGCAIVTSDGTVLGEAVESQQVEHLSSGGIIPTFAEAIHRENLPKVCERVLRTTNMRLSEVDAIAITTEPGLSRSLNVGLQFAQQIASKAQKPLIPIHHMKAHALVARMVEKIDFPYLTLLISGGHTLLAIADDVDQFSIIGQTSDNALGEALDKVARRLKLSNMIEFESLSGGLAIELAARRGTDPHQFKFPIPMMNENNCLFSFAYLVSASYTAIVKEESVHDIKGDGIIPSVYNFCAGLQLSIAIHLCRRLQIAIEYLNKINHIPEDKKVLVISGGVACNDFFVKALDIVCSQYNYRCVRAPRKWCNDNGVMIAWNGVEKWMKNIDIVTSPEKRSQLVCNGKAPIGKDLSNGVIEARIKCKRIDITKILF